MVVHRHSYKLSAHDQTPGQVEVIATRLETPGGVIVEKEQAARPVEQRKPKELSPIDRCLSTGPEGELAESQETVAPIQAHESEDFAVFPLHPADQEFAGNLGLIELFRGQHFSLCKSLTELHSRQKGGHLGRSKAWTGR